VIRVLHFSDVHVQEPLRSIPAAELLGKRALAALNLVFSRGKHFREVLVKLGALCRFARDEAVDLALCSGDHTALGTHAELFIARSAIAPLTELPHGYLTVPGNHDLYARDALRDGRFERYFGDLQQSDLPEYAADGAYPFVRLVGSELAVVGVNSARPNSIISSAGRVPDAQVEALSRVLDDARLAGRFVIVMTHYGILRRGGQPDHAHHGLENADELMRVCSRPRVLFIHGHIHHHFCHAPAQRHPWLFCAGSATHHGREGAWLYELDPSEPRAVPVCWREGDYVLDRDASVRLY
jgi:3',5'-cyclic AMP phosphodiesterase CpdA